MKLPLAEFLQENYEDLRQSVIDVAAKSGNGDHAEDMLNDVLLYINKYDEAFLENLHNQKQLRYFVVRAFMTQLTSKKSKSYTDYRKLLQDSTDAIELHDKPDDTPEADQETETFFSILEDVLELMYYTRFTRLEQAMFEKYVKDFKNQRQLAEGSQINIQRVSSTLMKCSKKIDREMQKFYPAFTIKGKLKNLAFNLNNVENRIKCQKPESNLSQRTSWSKKS